MKEEIAELRKLIKKIVPTVSVRMQQGTGRGWIEVSGSGPHGDFTSEEILALKSLGLNPGAGDCLIAPSERRFWIEHLKTVTEGS